MRSNTFRDFFEHLGEEDRQKVRDVLEVLKLVIEQNSAESYYIELSNGKNEIIALNIALHKVEFLDNDNRISISVKNGTTKKCLIQYDWQISNENMGTRV
ncbi:hypothetical protein REC12_09210 [Desulfosporosinus sp. PR]|uniref:hypothetical protein n=1 Tax=Candidatus Desulfosporosinus nitrosoreducens TaxID=3401928 RepID=UPI0027E92254|nr:hypothetical protein [Desulfosporosinus sp. PR]MDQ7093769.1 hypothetical protein [Desulfosporosinus sp. PR]